MVAVAFWIGAFAAFVFGIGVILSKNPMHSAISLVLMFLASAGLFLTLHAEFLAWILIIVYTGAVMVLMIFVLTLLNLQRETTLSLTPIRQWGIAAVVLFVTVFMVALLRDSTTGFSTSPRPSASPDFGSMETIATDLFTRYVYPFEIAAILLTAAVIGAVAMARQSTTKGDQDS